MTMDRNTRSIIIAALEATHAATVRALNDAQDTESQNGTDAQLMTLVDRAGRAMDAARAAMGSTR